MLALVMLFAVATVAVAAKDYTQPFDRGQNGVSEFRIPSLYTLSDGSVLAIADARYKHGSDSPNNIDILAAISADGYNNWEYFTLNHFDDYADGITDINSASFIDCAAAQSSTGRIFVVTDAQLILGSNDATYFIFSGISVKLALCDILNVISGFSVISAATEGVQN